MRKVGWSRDFYVIVEAIEERRKVAQGIPTKQGQLSRLYGKDPGWRQGDRIPGAQEPVWLYLPQVDLSAYQINRGYGRIYELHHRLFWGKYKGLTIEEMCQEHMDYIEWAVATIETSFCLSKAAISHLVASGLPLKAYTVELNQAKLPRDFPFSSRYWWCK